MSFDLTITFSGLTLFVPGTDRISALLPAIPPEMPHQAVLQFDGAYLGRGGGVPYRQDLAGWTLDLTGLAGSSGLVALPPGLADVGAAVGRRLSRRQLGPSPDDSVASRVALPAPTVMTRAHGGFWDLGPQMDVEMTHHVEWTLRDVEGDSLQWGLYGLRGITALPLPDLHPVNGKIVLQVLHLPDDDAPSDPPCGAASHHFGFYYALFGPQADGPLPLFRAPPLAHPCQALPGPVPGAVGGSFYTCMMGMSTVGGS